MSSTQRWFRIFPSDWLSRTGGLSPAERGVLITLVCMMLDRGEPLARNDARLARHCGMPAPAFRKALDVLLAEGKVEEVEGGIWAEWVATEIKIANEKTEAASRSAKARWGEKDSKNNSTRDATALRVQSVRNANQNQNITPIGPEGRDDDFDLSGMSREIGTYTAMGINRQAAATARCQLCGAGPAARCTGTDGAERIRPHIERYQRVACQRKVAANKPGELPIVREGDPLVPFLEKVRGRPIIWGARSTTTATTDEIEQARAKMAGAA